MNIENFNLSVIYTRPDGSYIVNQGLYHVPNEGEWADLWAKVDTYAKEHPEVVMPEPGKPEPAFDEVKTNTLSLIDSTTTRNIISGFYYTINGEQLHFSYNIEDQQNFSDTFNGIAMKKLMGFENLPETIDWNGWRNHTTNFKGELVVLTLTPDDFLNLYTQGALVHKQTHLEIGKQRKKAVENASSVDEINNLLKEWNI